jgi:hypothetical protein
VIPPSVGFSIYSHRSKSLTEDENDDHDEEDWEMTLHRYPRNCRDTRGGELVKLNWPSVTIAARLRHCLCKEHDRGGGDR